MLHEMMGVDGDSQGYFSASGDRDMFLICGLFSVTFQTIITYL